MMLMSAMEDCSMELIMGMPSSLTLLDVGDKVLLIQVGVQVLLYKDVLQMVGIVDDTNIIPSLLIY
jgi:hypothetical protein